MSRLAAVAILSVLLAAGCGVPGEPLPPSLHVPEAVGDLRVQQVGERLLIRFTLPALTTDGVVVRRFHRVELRAGPPPEGDFDTERWAAQAREILVPAQGPGPVEVSLPVADGAGKEWIIGVRAWGRTGRPSAWSNLVAVQLVPALPRPAQLQAEATAVGVRLTWRTAALKEGVRYRVFRRGPGQPRAEAVGESADTSFLDSSAAFGQDWEYSVQAFLKAGDQEALSEISEVVSIRPEDRFPPAPPTGLQATPGLGAIELLWDANPEPDLEGYRVWRAAGNGKLAPLTGIIAAPAYSDRDIEAGKRYRYAVSAVDARGNESALSSPVEVVAP
ncbi:MAG: hypothetical protein RMI94_14225 [Bryobacterales bacterium]|nr:hypothetical protein [Bryobacteraceae bacterium]MDW8131704.1 hypothetical protein [Bryobacterales bacterium]